jgi:hypothetical protein
MAHLFSLTLMRDIFAKQMQQGKGPQNQGQSGVGGVDFGNA